MTGALQLEAMRLIIGWTTLATTLALLTPLKASPSEQCESPNLKAIEVEKCLAETQKTIKESQRKPVSFPAMISGKTFDEQTQKYRTMAWISKDGLSLRYETTLPCTIVCSGGNVLVKEIPRGRIVSYTQGVAGEGSTAGDALVGTAVAAAIVPILAPFQALTTTRRTMTFAYTVTYVNDEGAEVTDNLFADSLVPISDTFYTFLPTLTGLQYGEKRPMEQLLPYYREGAERLEQRVKADEALLLTRDTKKPWCSKIQADAFPLIFARYAATLKKLDVLRQRIGLKPYPTQSQGSEESLWMQHLSSNPNFAIWAKANPVASGKIKSCSY